MKHDLEPGHKRRPTGSIQTVEIDVRCVFYRHALNAENEKQRISGTVYWTWKQLSSK